MTTLARTAARALERGQLDSVATRAFSRLVGSLLAGAYRRPLEVPPGVRIVGVGGATLGGSWKTPTAIALAAALSARGASVAFVGHGHRGLAELPQRVSPSSSLADVGDEALLAACRLSSTGVPVIVGGELGARLRLAAESAEVLVVDGLTRGALDRSQHHLLAVDAHEPWGHGQCFPAGDLRAPIPRLLEAGASLVTIAHGTSSSSLRGAHAARYELVLPALAAAPSSLVTALARPRRLLSALARRGIAPTVVLELPDHGGERAVRESERALARRRDVEVVLASEKCARHLGSTLAGLPVVPIGLDLVLPTSLLEEIEAALLRAAT